MKINLLHGDCAVLLQKLAPASVNLVVTSPPYANARRHTYGGTEPEKYVDWFLPISQELLRVLSTDGSFILNIKECVTKGERNIYVLELILALRRQGWLWTEEYCWHKTTCYPGKWPNRFRDAWERCLHFTKHKKFAMYQDAVKVPMKDSTARRLEVGLRPSSVSDKKRTVSSVGNKFGRKVDNWANSSLVYPDNVLHFAPGTDKNHSAVFPTELPEFFIRLFSKPGDVVLDPFAGSGTTLRVASKLGRKGIGMEIVK